VGKTGIAFIGCGYVADFYLAALQNHSGSLVLRGVYDRDAGRLSHFCGFHNVQPYPTIDAVITDPQVDIVVNLTNPDQHFIVSKSCLEAGKHVYSEKPLAMTLADAEALVALAARQGCEIAVAPASVLGEAAQTLWRALRMGVVGTPRLIYSEIDDGMVHRLGYENWLTASNISWPAEDEFRTGCTLEHAGYALAWLAALFGPVRRVVSFATLVVPDKGARTPKNYSTPDFSVGCLQFDGGVSARITNSIVAPHDHRLRIFGDLGELCVDEIWDFAAPVKFRPALTTRVERLIEKKTGLRRTLTIPPVRRRRIRKASRAANLDFAIGITEMAEALIAGRQPRLGGNFGLHITEVSLALQYPERFGVDYRVKSDFTPMVPMLWAP
jgi:predicted dehydrogenase